MFKVLDAYSIRSAYIALAFMLFATMKLFLQIPGDSFLIFSSCVIYLGFTSGAVIRRAPIYLYGNILGVFLVICISRIIYFDYRLEIIFIIIISGLIEFSFGLSPDRLALLIAIYSEVMFQWMNKADFHVQQYIADRFIATLIAVGVCICLEYFVFKRSRTTYLAYTETKFSLDEEIRQLQKAATEGAVTLAKIAKNMQSINQKITRVHTLANDLTYEDKIKYSSLDDKPYLESFFTENFHKILNTYYLAKHVKNEKIN